MVAGSEWSNELLATAWWAVGYNRGGGHCGGHHVPTHSTLPVLPYNPRTTLAQHLTLIIITRYAASFSGEQPFLRRDNHG